MPSEGSRGDPCRPCRSAARTRVPRRAQRRVTRRLFASTTDRHNWLTNYDLNLSNSILTSSECGIILHISTVIQHKWLTNSMAERTQTGLRHCIPSRERSGIETMDDLLTRLLQVLTDTGTGQPGTRRFRL